MRPPGATCDGFPGGLWSHRPSRGPAAHAGRRVRLDAWLAANGTETFKSASFRLGVFGFEVSGCTDAPTLAGKLPQRRDIGYLLPQGDALHYGAAPEPGRPRWSRACGTRCGCRELDTLARDVAGDATLASPSPRAEATAHAPCARLRRCATTAAWWPARAARPARSGSPTPPRACFESPPHASGQSTARMSVRLTAGRPSMSVSVRCWRSVKVATKITASALAWSQA